MAKDIKIVQVAFNILDPDQRAFYEYVQLRPNQSGYIKRLIQRDIDQAHGLLSGSMLKMAGTLGSVGGAYMVYRSLPEIVLRRRLESLFKTGEIYLKIVGYKKRELRKYPKIKRVTTYFDRQEAVFTLPEGVNPELVLSHDWLFKQVFGNNLTLEMNEDDPRIFVMKSYGEKIKHFDYDLTEVQKQFAGLELPIYAGKDRNGYVVYDLVPNPGLLIAGETGSGKSACVRSVITTLIQMVPTLELYCADLKMSEFGIFKGIAKSVVMDSDGLRLMASRIRKECTRRSKLLEKYEVEHVNKLPKEARVSYIVFAVDEISLVKKEKDIMNNIEEISSIGRALGIFLILSMQRPDAHVLDGALKVNLTVRFAHRTSDVTNSRIVLDSVEAAQIRNSEKGKMYMKFDGISPVQGPFLDIDVAKKILAPFKMISDVPNTGERVDITEEAQEIMREEEAEEEEEIEMGVLG
ncbi:hypothetical protein PMSD_18305 [Paenibacillus macquariensis subsp. defensor]|nr:hypothetical protein PMSD_18305 [Paenibacillus macquariensis subsp. defensor]